MSTHCEEEFMLKNIWFHHKRPIIFVTSQFGPHALYPAWNAIQLIYHIIVLTIDGSQAGKQNDEPTGNYFLYLPNWAYMLLVLSNIVDLAVTLYVHCLAKYILEERENEKAEAEVVMRNKAVKISYKTMGKYYKMRGYLKVSWVFFTLSSVVGITVTILYWTVHFYSVGMNEYSSVGSNYNLNGMRIDENTLDFGTLAFTFLNTIVILIHITITAKPFRLLHFYMPVIFVAAYVGFSIIYQWCSGNYIYNILDWDQVFPTTGIAYGVVFIVVPLVHLVVYGLVQARIKVGTWCRIKYSFRKWKKKKIRPAEPEVDPQTNVMRWLASSGLEKTDSRRISGNRPSASSSRATSHRAEISSV
ncbi:uncharacterized protein LOC123529437 [Mercenaria mercenaria]|uniref:uncharacterized protein LOC123529437 n=1 Tax=Mercenaria mercenaria TaxID=6596 RepID=UPI001E1DD7B3|nr:uncharacterized protein LOC123529437 [Mercenaria mercenaria]